MAGFDAASAAVNGVDEVQAEEARLARTAGDWAPDLDRYKRYLTESRDATSEARLKSQTDIDYYDDRQWTSEQIKALRKRKQPEIWVNRIKPAINAILGVLEQGRTDPRAFPRTNDDMGAAEIATDSLRYAAENARWQRTRAACSKDYLIAGIGAVIVGVDADMDPKPERIRWEEFFYDPYSRDPDFEDARYLGIAKWMFLTELQAEFPEAELTMEFGGIAGVDADEDKPGMVWGDSKRKRVLVAEMYVIDDGGWKRVVFYGGGLLEAAESPYNDERDPSCPIVAQSCYVDRDNQRSGVVRSMVPIQDEINMRRSKLLHLVNSRQLRQSEIGGADVSVQVAREEAARPDGVIPFGYDLVPTSDMAAGQAQLLQESKAELERMGPAPGILGRQSADSSGRAQLVRQQAGLTEMMPVLAGIEDLELRVYRQMWNRIRQFWTEPRMVRVTDDIGAPKFLTVNEPKVVGRQVVMDENGQSAIQPIMEYSNRPAEMDMDIIIDATPDSANIQAEQFSELIKLAGIYGPAEVPFDDLLEASSLPKKRQLIEKREARQKQAAGGQQPNPLQMAGMKAELENKAADTEQKKARALRDTVAAHAEGQGAMMERYTAQTQIQQPYPQQGF